MRTYLNTFQHAAVRWVAVTGEQDELASRAPPSPSLLSCPQHVQCHMHQACGVHTCRPRPLPCDAPSMIPGRSSS
eukprot:188119-Chlamydomonas_euryale.AAC.2